MLAPLPLPKSRLEALTDGIFAVTMTLLVLDLKLPEHLGRDHTEVVASLLALLPHVDDYVISFVVLCVFWLAHLRLLARLRDVDATFVWLNLAFLLFTTFVPTLTSLIGNNADRPVAAILYGCNLLLILLCETLMWRHASRHHFNDSVLDAPGVWQVMRKKFLFAAAVIVAGVACALLEIAFATRVDYASYVYLLLIVAGVVRKDDPAKTGAGVPSAPRASGD
jgi:uncharacterized membrane protein